MRTAADLALSCEPEHGCITCGDEAVSLRVLRVDAGRGLALCEDAAGERTTIEVALIDPVKAGDALLAHAGTAISNLPAPTQGSTAELDHSTAEVIPT